MVKCLNNVYSFVFVNNFERSLRIANDLEINIISVKYILENLQPAKIKDNEKHLK